MKKIALFFLMMVFAASLAACNTLPEEVNICLENPTAEGCPVICPAGQELDIDTASCVPIAEDVDPLVCPTGQHIESDTCVIDPLVCPTGQSDVDGACVLDDTRTPKEIVADFIVGGFDSDDSGKFLISTMALMDFSNAMTVTTDISFKVTEDIDETHYIEGQLIDSMIEDDVNGTKIQRRIVVDVDDEFSLDFTVIYHEVPTGVNVYIQPEAIYNTLLENDPEIVEVLQWVGFDQPWAVFAFDDSLEAVIQVAVLKDMFVDLFFSEMGNTFFTDFQNDLEEEIGFDLNKYGLDLGLLMDELIEEDYTTVETMVKAIDYEAIALHLDAYYVSPELLLLLEESKVDLSSARMDITKLALLNTATRIPYTLDNPTTAEYDPIDSHWEVTMPIDPLKGTQAFLSSLNDDDIEALIEVVIKPIITEAVTEQLSRLIEVYDLEDDFEGIFYQYQSSIYYLEASPWYIENATYDDIYIVINEINDMGVVAYYQALTVEEASYLRLVISNDTNTSNATRNLNVFVGIEERIEFEAEVVLWLTNHNTELLAMGYLPADITAWITEISDDSLEMWINDAPKDLLALAIEHEVYARIEAFRAALELEEGPEWVVNEIFSNPFITEALVNLGMNPLFDQTIIATNFMAVDFDLLALEEIDVKALGTAIQAGPTAYAAYLVTLELTAPNSAAILEVLVPAVETAEPYMMYVDDMVYAFDGLSLLEDFIDPSYYLDNILDIEVSATVDFQVLTVFDIDGLAYATLFNDLKTNFGSYLAGFDTMTDYPYDEDFVCLDATDDDCDDLELNKITALLTTLQKTEGYMLMDPSDPTWFELEIDFTDLADGLVAYNYTNIAAEKGYIAHADNGDLTGVTEMIIMIRVEDEAVITLPLESVTTDVNMVVQDVAKFAMTMEALEYLENIAAMYVDEGVTMLLELEDFTIYLEDIDDVEFSGAFDLELSFVSIEIPHINGVLNVTGKIEYSITLYWLDGTLVFDGPVGLLEVAGYMLDGDLTSEAAFESMVGKVAEENWHTSKLFMVYLLDSLSDYTDTTYRK